LAPMQSAMLPTLSGLRRRQRWSSVFENVA
jgi:hypothetical protein